MSAPLSQSLRDPTPLIAGALVLLGLVGSFVGPDRLILLAGLGMFGPFVLRESGVLPWRDEFQRETTLRAGMHALLAVGVLVTATMATQGYGGINLPMDSIRASTVLLVLGLTWILSKILQFWGAQRGAFRLLTAYVGVVLLIWAGGLAIIGFHRHIDASPTSTGTLAWVALLIWIGALADCMPPLAADGRLALAGDRGRHASVGS